MYNIQYKKIIVDFLKQRSYQDLAHCEPAIQKALEWVNENVASDVFNLVAIGSSDPATYDEQNQAREVLFQFLEKVIDFSQTPALFQNKSAPALKAQIFDSSNLFTNDIHIYQSLQNLGIQEKYIQGLLSKTHWLTDLDIQRSLQNFDLKDKVKITPFTESCLRATIDLAVKDHADFKEPYSIPLILNRGGVGSSQGIHWFSGQITVNPLSHTISYRIDDSLKLSADDNKEYKDIIENAVASKTGEFHNPFPATEGWSINEKESTITGHESQTDTYSCGYRALRQLVSYPDVRAENTRARAYSELPMDSSTLVDFIFRDQLENLSVSTQIFDVLSLQNKQVFSQSFASSTPIKAIDPAKVNLFLTNAQSLQKKAVQAHQRVEKSIAEFTPNKSLIRFPEGAKDESLTAVEYDSFFSALHDIEHIEQSNLKRIDLAYITSNALDGITSYFTQHRSIVCEELCLFIDPEPSVKDAIFFSKLKLSISSLSKAGLQKIQLCDDKNLFNKEAIEDLKAFAATVGITCTIKLPEKYNTTALQRELDRIIEQNQKKKNNSSLSEVQPATNEKSTPKAVRTREKLHFSHSKQVDIELQDSIEAEVALEMLFQQTQEQAQFVIDTTYTLEDLSNASYQNDFTAFSKLKLAMKKEDFFKAWHQIFGNITQGSLIVGEKKYGTTANQTVYASSLISKISDAALEQLLKEGRFPANGIDFQYLPDGFVLINDTENNSGRILHYDPNYKKQNLIAPVIGDNDSGNPLSMDTVDEVLEPEHLLRPLWDALNQSETYNSVKHQQFRCAILDVLSLPPADQNQLIGLCGGPEQLDLDRLNAFFKMQKVLSSLYTEPLNPSSILNLSYLDQLLHLSGDNIDIIREGLIRLASKAGMISSDQHPIWKVLGNHPETMKKIRGLCLTPETLNDLIKVYSSHGDKGIEKVLTTWAEIGRLSQITPDLVAQIISNSNPLKDILSHDDLLASCERLKNFSTSQREWFLKLYQNHSPKSDKNFVGLLASFNEFSRQIENTFKLSFYSLQGVTEPFSANVDMRTAMGRMLSILESSNRRDIAAQWESIAEIDLSSNAAIRAIRADGPDNRRCSFVVPEMALDPEEKYLDIMVFDTVKKTDDIAPRINADNIEEVEFNADDATTVQKRFFRYLSYQEQRMPLSFYKKAVKQIEDLGRLETKIERPQLNILYRILADISTGKNYEYFIRNEQQAYEQWNHILETIKKFQLEKSSTSYRLACLASGRDLNADIYKMIISSLGHLKTLPSMHVMDKLVSLMASPIAQYNNGSMSLSEFKSAFEKLAQANLMLSQLTNAYSDKVYMGMKFYNEENYQKIYAVPDSQTSIYGATVNLFDHHMLVAFSLHMTGEGFVEFAIPLISTFSLDHDNIRELCQIYKEKYSPINAGLMQYFGTILQDIQDNSRLDDKSLKQIMTDLFQDNGLFAQIEAKVQEEIKNTPQLAEKKQWTEDEEQYFVAITAIKHYLQYSLPVENIMPFLPSIAKPMIADYLEKNALLKAALPEGYVDNLKSKKATGIIAFLIEKEFKNPKLKQYIEQIVAKLSLLSEDKLAKLIKDIAFILNQSDTESEKLEVANNLSNAQLFEEGPESYEKLLELMKRYGSSPLVYFIKQAQKFADRSKTSIKGLCGKAAYFIGDAIPNLSNRFKHLNIIEFSPLISSVISAGQLQELSSELKVGERYDQWSALIEALSVKNHPEAIEKILAEFDTSLASSLSALPALKEHLVKLKNPTITPKIQHTIEEEVKVSEKDNLVGLTQYRFEERLVDVPQSLGILKTFFNLFITEPTSKKEQVKKIYKITTSFQEIKEPAELNCDLMGQVLSQAKEKQAASITYAHALAESIGMIDKLIEQYPSAKTMLLPLTKSYLEYKSTSESEDAHIKKAYGYLKKLYTELSLLNDKNMIISLCEHFSNQGQYEFTDLMTLFNGGKLRDIDFFGYLGLNKKAKKQLFWVMTSLLNNKKTWDLSYIQQIITSFNDPETGSQYLEAVTEAYKKAPYPDLLQFNQWWQAERQSKSKLKDAYHRWSKTPVARENISQYGEKAVNGFDVQYAKQQSSKISGTTYTDEELNKIQDNITKATDLATNELLEQINTIRKSEHLRDEHQKDPTELVALVSELLYRTKGMPQVGIGNERKWGNSFEINTTQYLAIHSLLKSDKPTIAGIGTGEGKSRIMMISLAAQWALGRTVDFVTADVTLATRDYLEYQAYFKAMGIETNLITAQTPVEQYCTNGINFSDASNLSLFRNKARSQGLGDKAANPNPSERCLLLDEADKTLFDTIDTRYNYSAPADPSIQDMPWIYESLIKFFKDPVHQALFHGPESDADKCNLKFKAYVKANLCSPKDTQKLERISRAQLESWQASAITALNLEYGKDFTLEANVAIVTKKGPSIVSQARLISGGVASKTAKFSFGVHQCLHARLNLEKEQLTTHGATPDNLLHQELGRVEFDNSRFPVDTENQIIYSSSSKSLIDDYAVIRGVTGTPGSWTERAEKANMTFIDIPRHRGINRIDRPYKLVKNDELQLKQMIAEIRISILNKQPILLICKDDTQSKKVFDYLNQNLNSDEKKQLNRVSADTSIEEESDIVEHKAGQAGAITVSTARIGRGTDIKLIADAKANGLHVVATYLPRERDYIQIIGRSGRLGAHGSSRLILSEESMRSSFTKLDNNFYTATESYLTHLQKVMDIQIQKQRIIKDSVSDFRMNLTNSFFDKFFKPIAASKEVNHSMLIDSWRKFFDESDKVWNETWPKISEALAHRKMEEVETLLQDYQAEVQGYWKGMIEELKMNFTENKAVKLDALPEAVGAISLNKRGIELLKYDVGSRAVFKTTIVDKHDTAYEGRAVIYKGFWKNLIYNVLPSIFSWNDTPYTQARKNGNMSWSQFLFGGNLGTPLSTEDKKFSSSLSEQQAIEKVDIQIKGSSTIKIFNSGIVPLSPVSQAPQAKIEAIQPKTATEEVENVRLEENVRASFIL